MNITFTDRADLKLTLPYPREFSTEEHLSERFTETDTQWGSLQLKECWFEGACLVQTRFLVNNSSSLHLRCDHFCWMMNFVISGGITSLTGNEEIRMEQGTYQTFYCPVLDMQLNLERPAEILTICLTRRCIRKLFKKDLGAGPEKNDNITRITLVTKDARTHHRLEILLREISAASQTPHIRRIYLEAKILELLSIQLETLERPEKQPNDIDPKDAERLWEARQLIDQNLRSPLSLTELARRTGLNDFKLKRGFKLLFGHTVFGYLTELRMTKAYDLLSVGHTVNQVAEAVGYKNAHHFTVAFKKRFKQLPSQLS